MTNVIAFPVKTPASKARVAQVQREGLAALKKIGEDDHEREERKRLRIQLLDVLRDAMGKAFALLGKTDAEFAISLAFEDVKKMQKLPK